MFEAFIRERRYLCNVSEHSINWYRLAFRWLPNDNPTAIELRQVVTRMREDGLKASSVNSYRTAINAYLHWKATGGDVKCSPSCPHPKMPKMKEEKKILPTFSVDDINKLAAWKPKQFYEKRLHTLLLMLADTGCRIDEVLTLKWTDVDFDNLLMTVTGKGNKQRRIPFSFELRKHLFRFKHEHQLVFPTREGKKLMRRNVLRDAKRICRKLGVVPPVRTLHALRHSFAIHYLRKGGSVFHLQKVLGHSTLEMTRRYANLMTEDLQKIHQQISLLSH
jgi:integrase/recombinase XerD